MKLIVRKIRDLGSGSSIDFVRQRLLSVTLLIQTFLTEQSCRCLTMSLM